MQSFLLISSTSKAKEYIQDFCEEKNIGKFDVHTFSSDTSFGIEDVRNFQKIAYIAPRGKEKVLIIQNAEKLTTEAQNALLKLLEEPPSSTFIFLVAQSQNIFLPTILSRCNIRILQTEKGVLTEEEKDFSTNILVLLISGSVGEKLATAEKLASDKEQLLQKVQQLLLFVREKMIGEYANPVYPLFVTKLQKCNELLQTTNVSPREILEHVFLSQS